MDLSRIRHATDFYFELLSKLNISESDKLLLTKMMENIATSAFVEWEYDWRKYWIEAMRGNILNNL